MALKIIHNHNLLSESIYCPSYPLQHICAFRYNSQFNQVWRLEWNYKTCVLEIVSGDVSIILDTIPYGFSKYSLNVIEYSNNILWVGYSNGIEHSFYIVDMVSQISHKYQSALDTRLIIPIGRDYWMYVIDKKSSVPIFTWESLTRLEPNMIPILVIESDTILCPVTIPGTNVSFVSICNRTIDFLNWELETISSTNVINFFSNYSQLTHPSFANSELKYLVTVNDNCLLYYEWFDVIDSNRGDISGCESILCFDFTTEKIIPFTNKQLDYFVTDIFPFRDFDGVIKLCSSEYYPAGDWKKIYEPEIHLISKVDTSLGKRKAEIQITPKHKFNK